MNHPKIELLKIRVFIYFLMISVGLEFVRGLAWWFWPRVFHEIQLDIGRGSRHLRAWLETGGFSCKATHGSKLKLAIARSCPNLLNFSAGLLQCPLLWKWAGPRLNDPRKPGRNSNIFYALDSEVVHLCFHWIFLHLYLLALFGGGDYKRSWTLGEDHWRLSWSWLVQQLYPLCL